MMMTNQANSPFSFDDLCELANLEGDLLVIAAHEKLGIGIQPDEDGFTDNVWAIGHMAQTFARKCGLDSLRNAHPSCKVLFDDVIALGRTVCPGAWDHFFEVGLEESRAILEGW
ncbi:TPA: hypothetical protein PXJ35_002445 [Yersinia enterocolitica]|nr:hypothetical protein [Yersinia enterocolitica]HDL6655590.1 hypothetical protein [Yersinia enterocolitica]HDL6682318.1 hypothetical protein [Yersinia enterocolitica]